MQIMLVQYPNPARQHAHPHCQHAKPGCQHAQRHCHYEKPHRQHPHPHCQYPKPAQQPFAPIYAWVKLSHNPTAQECDTRKAKSMHQKPGSKKINFKL